MKRVIVVVVICLLSSSGWTATGSFTWGGGTNDCVAKRISTMAIDTANINDSIATTLLLTPNNAYPQREVALISWDGAGTCNKMLRDSLGGRTVDSAFLYIRHRAAAWDTTGGIINTFRFTVFGILKPFYEHFSTGKYRYLSADHSTDTLWDSTGASDHGVDRSTDSTCVVYYAEDTVTVSVSGQDTCDTETAGQIIQGWWKVPVTSWLQSKDNTDTAGNYGFLFAAIPGYESYQQVTIFSDDVARPQTWTWPGNCPGYRPRITVYYSEAPPAVNTARLIWGRVNLRGGKF